MKSLNIFLVTLILTAININSTAQTGTKASGTLKTETFKVWGKCDLCKERIETAAKDEGAASASWSDKTKMLTVTFNPAKTSKDAISRKMASVGHDTEKYKAPDDVYAKLPACCHYERAK